MLDPKSGKVTFYQPPNRYSTPYGITVDQRRGHVWYGDTHPNYATRFDIKSGEFVEYPLPTANAAVRFLGVDPKGRAWFGGFWNGKFGMVDPGDGVN
jgi:streptogramin lyase